MTNSQLLRDEKITMQVCEFSYGGYLNLTYESAKGPAVMSCTPLSDPNTREIVRLHSLVCATMRNQHLVEEAERIKNGGSVSKMLHSVVNAIPNLFGKIRNSFQKNT